jgi:RNA polymerase sigma-70 factor (ECF subfamily)
VTRWALVSARPHEAVQEGSLRARSAQTLAVPGPRGPADDDTEQVVRQTTGDLTADLAGALHRAQHGDEEAFVALYRDVQPRLLRYATVLVGREAAGDVTGEAWLQITRDLHRFTGDLDGFRGWAAKIVHHRAMDLCRANARRPTVALETDDDRALRDQPRHDEDTATSALDEMSTETALALIATLPREQAQAVLLRAVVGLDARAAGEVLGKRAGAVRVAAHRGLKRLAQHVHHDAEEGRWTLVSPHPEPPAQ